MSPNRRLGELQPSLGRIRFRHFHATESSKTEGRRVNPKDVFRPDIAGLRGADVLLIVAFHVGIPGFRGGFIGEDVFFIVWFSQILRSLLFGTNSMYSSTRSSGRS